MKEREINTINLSLEAMPLCGLLTLYNPALILIGRHSFSLPNPWPWLIAYFLISSVLAGLLLYFVFPRYRQGATQLLRSVFFTLFLASTFYPSGGRRLDGVPSTDPSWEYLAVLYGIYAAAFCVVFLIGRRYKDSFKRVFAVSICICLAVVGYGVFDSSLLRNRQGEELSDKTDLSYGKEQNIIVFLADMFQGSTVEQYFNIEPEASEFFPGFTAFTRAVSPFPFTSYALPAILSGKVYAGADKPDSIENLRAAHADSFLKDSFDMGYNMSVVGIDTLPAVPTQSSYSVLRKNAYFSDAAFLCQLGIVRILKKQSLVTNANRQIEVLLHLKKESLKLIERLIKTPKGADNKKIIFIHNFLTHSPVYYSKVGEPLFSDNSQWTSSFTVANYMEETGFSILSIAKIMRHMQEISAYDNSLIIIAGDHGHFIGEKKNLYTKYAGANDFDGFEFGQSARAACMYNPLIMVKPANDRKPFRISHTAASLTDLRAVVNDYLNNGAGNTEEIIRNRRKEFPISVAVFREYTTTSPYESAKDHNLLRLEGNANALPQLFSLFEERFSDYKLGERVSPPNSILRKSWIREGTGAWLKDKKGTLAIKPVGFGQGDYSIRITAIPLIRNDHKRQRVSILANGVALGEIVFTEPEQTVQIDLPGSIVRSSPEKLSIEFVALDAISPTELGAWNFPDPISIFMKSFAIVQ